LPSFDAFAKSKTLFCNQVAGFPHLDAAFDAAYIFDLVPSFGPLIVARLTFKISSPKASLVHGNLRFFVLPRRAVESDMATEYLIARPAYNVAFGTPTWSVEDYVEVSF
jgi:hypothetical protein